MMIAYKLFTQHKDGTISSLFIDRARRLPMNKWLTAQTIPTSGYKIRPGWHCTPEPVASHLSLRGHVWKKVQIKDYYQLPRPKHQGGYWYIANQMKIL